MRVEVTRGPGVNAQPVILVQRRDDEPTYAMSVGEAHRWLEKEFQFSINTPCTDTNRCLWCAVSVALEGLA